MLHNSPSPLALATTATSAPLLALPTVTTIFAGLQLWSGFGPRSSQLTLAAHVRSTLSTATGVCCIEAPTGTGKTLGYLAGALEAQARSGNALPLVVATATVGLQEQILRHDIPRLVQAGAIAADRVAVAKGRGRYFCPRTAALLEAKSMADSQHDLFDTEKTISDGGVEIALSMLKSWRKKNPDGSRDWSGDSDAWTGPLPACWASTCAASGDTCVRDACPHFNDCPSLNAKLKLASAQIIVANHDLVLADLAMRAEDDSTGGVFPLTRYMLVIDEAHNLPDKAVATRETSIPLTDLDWLADLTTYAERIRGIAVVHKAFHAKSAAASLAAFSLDAGHLREELLDIGCKLEKNGVFAAGVSSWGTNPIGVKLRAKLLDLSGLAFNLVQAFKLALKALTEHATEATGHEKVYALARLAESNKPYRRACALYKGMTEFSGDDNLVRWIAMPEVGKMSLHAQPIEGCDVLKELLWDPRHDFKIPVALVSATLQISGSFDRFLAKSGLASFASSITTATLPPVFDYSRGYLHTPVMQFQPGVEGYEGELAESIERQFHEHAAQGFLVLFTAREAMKRVLALLPDELRGVALVQGSQPIGELVALHRARIDEGKRSILVGLDSLAEGLDLPGRYCEQVILTRLPFAPPSGPVEAARQEAMGKTWFEKAYLADMLTKLIQATGRLIRRETDHGVITVLDSRMTTKRYARDAILALPGFTHCRDLGGYFAAGMGGGGRVVAKPVRRSGGGHLSLVSGGR